MSQPRQLITDLWIPRELGHQIAEEAKLFRDRWLETGGVLMGYTNCSSAVVTALVGPGPDASHKRNSFRPDTIYQRAEIAAHFERSSGLDTYLGDWHSHPTGGAGQSWTDRRMLARLTRDWTDGIDPHRPLMLIVAENEWRCYCAKTETPPRMLPSTANFADVMLRLTEKN